MRSPFLPALMAISLMLPACTREESDAQVTVRARDFLLQRCQRTGKMIPGAKDTSIKALCDCSADRAVATFGPQQLATLLKNREFDRNAERVMHGIRNECMKQSGIK